jgi:ABC-type Fe3+-hydroxamate transport system substrate-binding protein
VDIASVASLNPDLVLANQEENSRADIEGLSQTGVPIWVTFPQSVHQALDLLWEIARLFHSQTAADRVRSLNVAVEWADSAADRMEATSYFCPIWFSQTGGGKSWWMTFNHQTYAHDVLRMMGGTNVFAKRERRYPLAADLGESTPDDPGERDRRYPRVTASEILAGQPEMILLPDEPYAFDETHEQTLKEALAGTPAVDAGRVHRVDGSLITWHGTRLAIALQKLPAYFNG